MTCATGTGTGAGIPAWKKPCAIGASDQARISRLPSLVIYISAGSCFALLFLSLALTSTLNRSRFDFLLVQSTLSLSFHSSFSLLDEQQQASISTLYSGNRHLRANLTTSHHCTTTTTITTKDDLHAQRRPLCRFPRCGRLCAHRRDPFVGRAVPASPAQLGRGNRSLLRRHYSRWSTLRCCPRELPYPVWRVFDLVSCS